MRIRCAKVYKEAEKRNFKQAVHYQEGRKVRNSRDARAMSKGSKFGRQQQEEAAKHRSGRTVSAGQGRGAGAAAGHLRTACC